MKIEIGKSISFTGASYEVVAIEEEKGKTTFAIIKLSSGLRKVPIEDIREKGTSNLEKNLSEDILYVYKGQKRSAAELEEIIDIKNVKIGEGVAFNAYFKIVEIGYDYVIIALRPHCKNRKVPIFDLRKLDRENNELHRGFFESVNYHYIGKVKVADDLEKV